MTEEDLLKFLEDKPASFLQGFYAIDNARNPYNYFNDYTCHLNFSNGNQSEHREFYKEFITW